MLKSVEFSIGNPQDGMQVDAFYEEQNALFRFWLKIKQIKYLNTKRQWRRHINASVSIIYTPHESSVAFLSTPTSIKHLDILRSLTCSNRHKNIYFISIAKLFLGDVLPCGQINFWGSTVICNLHYLFLLTEQHSSKFTAVAAY